MMTGTFKYFRPGMIDRTQVLAFVIALRQEWPNMGLAGIDLDAYANKLSSFAECVAADDFSAAVFFYCNDIESRTGYITLIGKRKCVPRGIGNLLHGAVVDKMREAGMMSVRLEVRKDNERAVRFYMSLGYRVAQTTETSYFMERSA